MAPRLILVALLVLAHGATAAGHHSISGQFDVSRVVTLRGTIAKVDWINPHAYIFLDLAATDGTRTTWALSTIPIAMLRKAGITSQSLRGKAGETVTVTAHPALNRRAFGWVTRITYPDGRFVSLFEG